MERGIEIIFFYNFSDFTLGELEVEDSDELADSQLSKEKKAPNKPIRKTNYYDKIHVFYVLDR